MHRGYAKIYRKFLEWEWYSDLNTKALFLHLLLTANHKDKKWKGIDIKKGQVLSGLKSLNVGTGLSESKLRTSLKKLKSTGEITIQSTNLYSIITVCNYCEYHDYDSSDNKQSNSPDDIPVTNESQANHNQVTTTKKVNHYKNEKEELLFDKFWDLYPRKINKKKSKQIFLSLAKKKDFDFEKVLSELLKQTKLESWTKDNGQFIPHPTTWLNGEKWNDEIESTTLNFTINTPPEFK